MTPERAARHPTPLRLIPATTGSRLEPDADADANFADVQIYPDRTAAELARGQLFRLQELVVGKPLPPIDGFGFKGQPVNSTIHQGKVLVLVFWASWWAPSIEIAEQERDLARRFQDKPVVLLGISGDNSLESAQQVADREKMSWPLGMTAIAVGLKFVATDAL